MKTILFEGNIGCGKSTLCQSVFEKLSPSHAAVCFEPVDLWRNFENPEQNEFINMLQLVNIDPFSFKFWSSHQ